ncbi:JAB domain-containing protein [Paraliomyxa miuraensis]|uniref:JAB domain-containing protein n=1 Tax=Paraliomyxa miuraensis TaxID=376150 RepID=UPI00225C0794|nr:JAB domain-containing protein [Paraliomyxa miuraensis]MCX4244193.1 hypothetical protein [Paraliomyxa miuraensis]
MPTWEHVPYGRKIESAKDLDFLRPLLGPLDFEVAITVGVDACLRLRSVHTVGIGTQTSVDFSASAAFRPLVMAGIGAAILVHNHPGGRSTPSQADVMQTASMVNAAGMVGIEVLDHVIVTRREVVSMVELGVLLGGGEGRRDGMR